MCTLKIKHVQLILPATIAAEAIAFHVMLTYHSGFSLCLHIFAAFVTFQFIICYHFRSFLCLSQKIPKQTESFLGNQQGSRTGKT